MNKLLLVSILMAMGFAAGAQPGPEPIKAVKGKVINRLTNEAVAFTNISIEDTFHGTASDEEGDFELKIPKEMEEADIQFSAVGFKIKKFPVETLFPEEFSIIKLEPKSYDIENVDIAARSRVLIRILRMAAENTRYNYLGGPFNLICRYQDEKIMDDTTRVNKQAKIVIYDKTGYGDPSRLDAFRMRKYKINPSEPPYRFSSGILPVDELLRMDWVRSGASVLNPSLLDNFELQLEEEADVGGQPSWIISFRQLTPTPEGSLDFHATSFEGKITIAKKDYSVLRIEGSATSEKHHRQGKSLAVGGSNTDFYQDVSYKFLVTYSQLKPGEISIRKSYSYKGKKVEERLQLTVEKVRLTDLETLSARDYFPEK